MQKTPKTMTTFKPGDLVKIRDGTHDPKIPDHRVGMIVARTMGAGNRTEAYTVVFLGTTEYLKFHEMFLEHVYEDNKEGENK